MKPPEHPVPSKDEWEARLRYGGIHRQQDRDLRRECGERRVWAEQAPADESFGSFHALTFHREPRKRTPSGA